MNEFEHPNKQEGTSKSHALDLASKFSLSMHGPRSLTLKKVWMPFEKCNPLSSFAATVVIDAFTVVLIVVAVDRVKLCFSFQPTNVPRLLSNVAQTSEAATFPPLFLSWLTLALKQI